MQTRDYETLLVATEARVVTLTLNRPERRNAIGAQMTNELLWALDDAEGDGSVGVIVLTGAGKAFCAGGDFSQMTGGTAVTLEHKGDFKDLLRKLWRTSKPVIAKVNGHAMGGGLGLVAASTLAIGSTEAKLGTPEIDVGLFPFMILAVLERVMPRRRLIEMMLRGERMSAEEAVRAGLLNRAVAPADLDGTVKALADDLASKSPIATRLGLEALRDTDELALDEKLPILSNRLLQCLATEDAREGLAAFLEKRAPLWKGQ